MDADRNKILFCDNTISFFKIYIITKPEVVHTHDNYVIHVSFILSLSLSL